MKVRRSRTHEPFHQFSSYQIMNVVFHAKSGDRQLFALEILKCQRTDGKLLGRGIYTVLVYIGIATGEKKSLLNKLNNYLGQQWIWGGA